MKSAFWRSIAVVALVAVPMMANANDATIGSEVANSAMYGGTLMNTTAVFNVFPHLVTGNGTGVELNTMNSGAGKIWWEAYDELWLTMDVGLMNYGMNGSAFMWGNGWNFVNPYAGSDIFSNFNMVNMGIAKPLSGGGAWAVGVKLAPFGGVESTDAADVTDEVNATGYGFNGSWGNGEGLHVGAEFAMTNFEVIDGAADETDEESTMGFGATGRYDTDLYIYQANFAYTTDGFSGDNFPEDDDTTALGFLFNAGRYLKNEVDGQATAEFGLGWAAFGNEVGDVTDDTSAFLLPAVRVSAWEKIGDYFGLMGGLGFTHAFLGNEFDDGTNTTEDKLAGSTFDWSAGLFFQPTDNVRLDARFESGNLNQVLSLGNDSPLVMYLGATVGLN